MEHIITPEAVANIERALEDSAGILILSQTDSRSYQSGYRKRQAVAGDQQENVIDTEGGRIHAHSVLSDRVHQRYTIQESSPDEPDNNTGDGQDTSLD